MAWSVAAETQTLPQGYEGKAEAGGKKRGMSDPKKKGEREKEESESVERHRGESPAHSCINQTTKVSIGYYCS